MNRSSTINLEKLWLETSWLKQWLQWVQTLTVMSHVCPVLRSSMLYW